MWSSTISTNFNYSTTTVQSVECTLRSRVLSLLCPPPPEKKIEEGSRKLLTKNKRTKQKEGYGLYGYICFPFYLINLFFEDAHTAAAFIN